MADRVSRLDALQTKREPALVVSTSAFDNARSHMCAQCIYIPYGAKMQNVAVSVHCEGQLRFSYLYTDFNEFFTQCRSLTCIRRNDAGRVGTICMSSMD